MQPPFGTPCANHLDTPASAWCGRCARAVCNSCVVFDTSGAATCSSCATAVRAGAGAIPWERRAELGLGPAFVQTVREVLLRPQSCFAPPPGSPELGPAVWFAILCHTLGFLFAVLWQVVMTLVASAALGGSGAGASELLVMAGVSVFAGPFSAVTWVFVWGGIVHVLLLLFGGARGGFTATARVQGYASAAALLQIVPIVGGMMAAVWSLVAQIVGLASAHQSGYGRSSAAVLAPMLLCCAAAIGMVVLMAVGFAEALPNQ